MRPEPRRRKRRIGRFIETIVFFLFFLVLVVAFAIGSIYIYRDRLLLEYVRNMDPHQLGVQVLAVDSLVTRPIGQVSIELRGLVLQAAKDSPVVRAERVVVSTPKNGLELYQMWLTRDLNPSELPLKTQLHGLIVQFSESSGETATPETTEVVKSSALPLAKIPFPITLETELRDSEIQIGAQEKALHLQGITGLVKTQIQTTGISNSGQVVLKAATPALTLPVRADWQAHATARENGLDLKLESLSLSGLGLTLKSDGELKWPERTFRFQTDGTTSDLSVIPLDKAESEALGLVGRLKGQAHLELKASGSLQDAVSAEGQITLKEVSLPFQLERTLGKEKPHAVVIRGPVGIDADVPFKISYDIGKKKLGGVDIQLATVKADLTPADVRINGTLSKASRLPFTFSTQVTSEGETVELSALELRLANLTATARGQVSLDPRRISKVDVSLSLPSLSGWPLLLPILGTIEGTATTRATDLNQAKGAFSLKAHIEAPLVSSDDPAAPLEKKVTVESFEAKDFEFPVNMAIKSGKMVGAIRGDVSGSGTLRQHGADTDWNLKRIQGAVDLGDLEVSILDVLNKAKNQVLNVSFAASSNSDLHLKIDKCDVRFRDSTASFVGTASRETVNGTATLKAALSQLYDLVPPLRPVRAKIPTGTAIANVKVDGTYDSAKGLTQSPIALNGRIGLKTPKAVFLEASSKTAAAKPTTKSAETDTSEATGDVPTIFHSPLIAKSKLIFDLQLDSVSVKTGELKGLGILATLNAGDLDGTAQIANAFGGTVKVSSFQMKDLDRASGENLAFTAKGVFQNLNLSQVGEFLNPQWKTVVGGAGTGTLNFSFRPFSRESIVDQATADGEIAIKQGTLSTVSLDQLANRKLSEYPMIAKLTGSKPALQTKGVTLAMQTAFSYAKGRLTLKKMKALSPEKNELHLEGWLQKDLTAELSGEAYLANSTIGGSFRQANSDKSGRLVVPVQISGSLTSPNLTIAESTLNEMTKKTIELESGKLKKNLQNKAVDAVKEELKKRGLVF